MECVFKSDEKPSKMQWTCCCVCGVHFTENKKERAGETGSVFRGG